MTNEDKIRSLSRKDLAALLIHKKYYEDIDYNWDEEPFSCGIMFNYITSDGLEFDDLDYKAALQHECWWLAQEENTQCVNMNAV